MDLRKVFLTGVLLGVVGNLAAESLSDEMRERGYNNLHVFGAAIAIFVIFLFLWFIDREV